MDKLMKLIKELELVKMMRQQVLDGKAKWSQVALRVVPVVEQKDTVSFDEDGSLIRGDFPVSPFATLIAQQYGIKPPRNDNTSQTMFFHLPERVFLNHLDFYITELQNTIQSLQRRLSGNASLEPNYETYLQQALRHCPAKKRRSSGGVSHKVGTKANSHRRCAG